jgi:hypothetical protein
MLVKGHCFILINITYFFKKKTYWHVLAALESFRQHVRVVRPSNVAFTNVVAIIMTPLFSLSPSRFSCKPLKNSRTTL